MLVNGHVAATEVKETVVIIVGYANVAELVDALDLGSSAERCVGSSPSIRTKINDCGLSGGAFLAPSFFALCVIGRAVRRKL